jgi:hypothetical protein
VETSLRASAVDGAIDRELLAALRSFEDPRAGYAERFLTPTFGDTKTVAVLSTPLASPRPIGWVVAPPYGAQQVNLASVEVALCRALAAAGFPVLRYHSRGYGDSQATAEAVSLASHLEDAREAVRLLRSCTTVETVGLTGPQLGGSVAALVADELSAGPEPPSALVLWEPVVNGRAHMQALLRLGMMTQLASRGRTESDEDPADVLRRDGVLEVQGFPMDAGTFDAVSRMDLRTDLRAFRGSALVVQVSKGARPRPDLEALRARLSELGGTAELDVLRHPAAAEFGRHQFRGLGDGTKLDVLATLVTDLVQRTVRWCESRPGESS